MKTPQLTMKELIDKLGVNAIKDPDKFKKLKRVKCHILFI